GKSPLIIAVMWAQYALSLLLMLMRFGIMRKVTQIGFGIEDYCIWINSFFFLGYVGFCTQAAVMGFGRHQWNLPDDQLSNANLCENIGQACAAISLFCCKSCVAFFLLRIIVRRVHRTMVYVAISIQAIVTVLYCVLLFTQITPVQGVWNPFLEHKRVNFDLVPFAISHAAVSALYDFFLGIAPWVFLRSLKVEAKERHTVCASFSIGISAGIFAVIRAIKTPSLGAKEDYSYETVEFILWTSSEITTSCISICIPPLRALYR
ncbi:hypothetical protein BS50DRAFT_444784, partial [Corynespora cassiicola Philippines]